MQGAPEDLPLTVYTPRNTATGWVAPIISASCELHRSRTLIWHLFLRDFHAQFRQRLLGYIWALLTPLIAIFGFIIMNLSGILRPGDIGVPYPLYVFVGVSIWGFLTTTLTAVSNGLLNQSDLLLRTNIPKIALAVSSLAQVGYSVVVHSVVLVLLLIAFQVRPSILVVVYPILVVPIILCGVALGLVVSVIGAIARDLTVIVQTAFNLLMYLTPVVYVASNVENGILQLIIWLNPFTYLIELPRSVLLKGSSDLWGFYLVVFGLALILLALCVKAFYMLQDLVAERL